MAATCAYKENRKKKKRITIKFEWRATANESAESQLTGANDYRRGGGTMAIHPLRSVAYSSPSQHFYYRYLFFPPYYTVSCATQNDGISPPPLLSLYRLTKSKSRPHAACSATSVRQQQIKDEMQRIQLRRKICSLLIGRAAEV